MSTITTAQPRVIPLAADDDCPAETPRSRAHSGIPDSASNRAVAAPVTQSAVVPAVLERPALAGPGASVESVEPGGSSLIPRPAGSSPAPLIPGAPLLPVVGGALPVPLLDGRTVRQANLDYAASAPALQAVADHVAEVLPYYASVHRGAGYASQVSTALYEGARTAVAEFVGARPDDLVVFTRNTTDSLNLLAGAVPTDGPGDVVVLDVEHHANLLPWTARRHRLVATAATIEQTLADLEAALAASPAVLVAVTGCSNVTGEVLPIARIAALAHRYGARIAVDGAQLVPHRRVNLAELGVDYLAFSGHKLYAPYGTGVLVGRPDWLDAATPYLAGGGAVRAVSAEGRPEWTDGPARHEAGSPNVLGAAAVAAACRTIAALPGGALEAHERALTERLTAGLQSIRGVRVLRVFADSTDRVGVVGFTVAGHDPGLVAAYLSAEHGIGVRDGKFCAHPLLARLDVPGGALRASVGVGSRIEDADRLIGAIRTFLSQGQGADYELVAGRWAPVADSRPAPAWAPWATTGSGSTPPAGSSPCDS